jgi:hypothetical protein
MIGAGAKYCRYSDDCRIFCRTEADARHRLEFLARQLFELYGLTLQSTKTAIHPVKTYRTRFFVTPERLEAESLETRFEELLKMAGVEHEYGESIDYDDLPEEVQAEIDGLNLAEVVREQIRSEKYDPILVSLLLQRLGQLGQDGVVEDLLTGFMVSNLLLIRLFVTCRRFTSILINAELGSVERFCKLCAEKAPARIRRHAS